MELNLILQAVRTVLDKAYPGTPVYEEELPKSFVRPSFFLEGALSGQAALGIGLVQETVVITIDCFTEVDAYSNSKKEALNARMDGVRALLCAAPLAVAGRSLLLGSVTGKSEADFAEITATYSYVDQRPGYRDAEAETPESGGAPLMYDYTLDIQA